MSEENMAVIAGAQEGDEEAWGNLVNQYSRLVWSATFGYTFTDIEREDIVQEVFSKLVHSIKNYDPDKATFTTFVAAITKNTCIDKLRKIIRNREDPVPPEELAAFASPEREDPIDGIYRLQLIESLHKAMVEKLTVEQRLVIKLFYFKNCSHRQIAEIMNRSEDWVKNALYRTRLYLREILARLER